MKRALICGISGQDGAYLAELLLSKGYQVFGTSRDAAGNAFHNLQQLNIKTKVHLLSMDAVDFRSVLYAVQQSQPGEIYFLAGQTSVGLSFEQPVEAIESISMAILNVLEVVRFVDPKIKIFNAGSSECFGDTGENPATEQTPFSPQSPYAVAKTSAHFLVQNYRQAYGLFACNGILFNHESPLRPKRFVTQKIVSTAAAIRDGSPVRLQLGNLHISRDWGWAPDYVEVMWRILQRSAPEDYVIATGHTISLEEFVKTAFAFFDLNWRDHTDLAESLKRPSDLSISRADPAKARRDLGWRHANDVYSVIQLMCHAAYNA